MKNAKRIAASLLAACMLGASAIGTIPASAATSVTAAAQSSKPAVKAAISGEKISLKWNAVSGAVKYRVCEYENDKLKKLGDVTGCRVNLTGARPGNTYTFAVSAYVDGGWTKVTKSGLVKITYPGSSAADGGKMLSLWTDDAEAKNELINYINAITTESSGDYIPVEDRIAVFDLDGTLFCETDSGIFQSVLLQYRVLEDPGYKDRASELERKVAEAMKSNAGPEALAGLDRGDMEKVMGSVFAGMTLEEYNECIQRFKQQPMDSYDGMLRGESFYRPMLQVVDYLEANGFTVYIVSGSGRFLLRGIIYNSMLDIPPGHLIGTDEILTAIGQNGADGAEYVFTTSDKLVLTGENEPINIGMNKVTAIAENIGKQPVLSFGNSSGDVSMANYTITGNKYRSLAFMLCCDDTERENGSVEKADQMYETCKENNYIAVSMKNDWKTIYGDGVTYTGAN